MGLLILIVAIILMSLVMLPMLFVMAAWYELGLDQATAQTSASAVQKIRQKAA